MSSKQEKKTLLLILIDAFPKTYFSKKLTPFLYNLAQDGLVTCIKPLFAFKGIETTTFTGTWPNVHNVWTEFRLANGATSGHASWRDKLLREIARTVDLIPNDGFRAGLRYATEVYIFQKPYRTPNLVPSTAMTYFELSQQKKITEPKSVGGVTTIFDVFRRERIPFVFIEPWIWGDHGAFRKVERLAGKNREARFWYVKYNHLDHLGHKFGPSPFAFREHIMKMDVYVEKTITLLRRLDPSLDVLVFSDHGMSQVFATVNMLEGLNCLKSKIYEDYVAFVDSTMIRFWFFTNRARQEIPHYLQHIKCGHVLTDKEKALLKIPSDTRYGETIYVLDEGYVMHPCFFHSKSVVRGMHGYAYPRSPEAFPILVAKGEIAKSLRISRPVTHADLAQSILNSLLPNISTVFPNDYEQENANGPLRPIS